MKKNAETLSEFRNENLADDMCSDIVSELIVHEAQHQTRVVGARIRVNDFRSADRPDESAVEHSLVHAGGT